MIHLRKVNSTIKNMVTIIFFSLLLFIMPLAIDYILTESQVRTIDLVRFYLASLSSFVSKFMSLGWVFYGPIPIPVSRYSIPFFLTNLIKIILYWIAFSILSKITSRIKSSIFSINQNRGRITLKLFKYSQYALLLCLIIYPIESYRQGSRDFNTKNELANFIISDSTDNNVYSGQFTCLDFTINLIDNANRLGYRLYFVSSSNHAFCKAYVVNEEKWYYIEPQTDMIEEKTVKITSQLPNF